MPASVALVHDDPSFLAAAASALEHAGFSVTAFSDSMVALDQIEKGGTFDTLVTRVSFPAGKPNGISLALMLRLRIPSLKVVFVARRENETYTLGIGMFIPHPVDVAKLVDAVCADQQTDIQALD